VPHLSLQSTAWRDWKVYCEEPMRASLFATVLFLFGGCQSERTTPARSERERDSILGESQLPGAQGVRGALRASDSADTRNARYDSTASEP
jgi:hypothetical protein